MRPVTVIRKIDCRASRAAVWNHISDTLRLNRAVGTSRLSVVARETNGLDRFEIRGRLGGITVRYLEQPFEWAEGKFFAFERRFLDGPARTLTTRYELEDMPASGCRVTVRVDLVPRFWVLRPIVWIATQRTMNAVAKYVASVDDTRAASAISSVNAEALGAAGTSLVERGGAPALVSRLVEHVASADDLELAPMRPFALARQWGADRRSILGLCLAAVPAGLLELRWALICPNCMTTSQVLPSLQDLGEQGHCHSCDLRYDTDFDRAVEALFFPHPSIRKITLEPYCIGGPALTPHVLAQLPLVDGATGTLAAPSEACRLQLFVRGGWTAAVDVAQGGPPSIDVLLLPGGMGTADLLVAPSGTLRVRNQSGQGRHAQLQRSVCAADAATAHYVSAMPEFRRLFGSEALRPGLALRVAQVAILFSDICGSTALYARVGDAAAFGLVMDCINYGSAVVERHRGTVVKTIGDAVMAAFVEPRDAAEAAAEMIARWREFVREHALAASIDLKVGAYAGPCTIVQANGTLDYFGQTVNAAARVQHLAGAGEIVLGDRMADLLGRNSTVESVERFAAQVKGIDEPLGVVRFRPALGLASPPERSEDSG